MKLTKIYTKTGDGGETSLVGGIRIAKNAPRIEAYGTVDELSSHLGLLAAMLGKDAEHGEEYRPIIETLERIQNNLFSISSILATDAEALRRKDAEWVKPYLESLEKFTEQLGGTETPLLERLTDEYNAELPALGSFIMPGGSVEAAQCHVCRAVCRRAERRIVDKVQGDKVQGDKVQGDKGTGTKDGKKRIYCNAQMTEKMIHKYAEPDKEGMEMLRMAMERFSLSARAYSRILKVARTIADLAGSERVESAHIAEAIGYRALDRGDWAER